MATPPKGHADYLELGDWNVECAVCGRKYKASECVRQSAGVGPPWASSMWVCQRDYRMRQPQDFVRGIPDRMEAPFVQPWGPDTFQQAVYDPTAEDPEVEINLCQIGSASIIGMVAAGQVIPVLTFNLGTGGTASMILNVYGYVGAIAFQQTSDPCLPSAINITTPAGLSVIELDFSVQPTASTSATPISPAVEVSLLDLMGNVITSYTGDITIALGSNPGGATLEGTLTQAAVAGVATFDDLVVNAAGSGYTLIATTAAGVAETSDAFNVAIPLVQFSDIHTLGAGNTFPYATNLDLRGFTIAGYSFYNGVLWLNCGTAGAEEQNALVFNLATQPTPITTAAFGAFRRIASAIYQETTPPGYAFLLGAATSNTYRMDFGGTVSSALNSGIADARGLVGCQMEDSVAAIFSSDYSSGGTTPMVKLSNLNWGAGTCTTDTNFGTLSPTYRVQSISYNGGVIDSRVYCVLNASGTFSLAYVNSTTGAATLLASFANSVACSMLAGDFGGGADTLLYNMSGNAGEANVLQKRSQAGVLLGSVALTGYSTTTFNSLAIMSYDYANDHVWVQMAGSPYTITCVKASTMEIVAQGAVSPTTQNVLLQPIGHPSGGVVTVVGTKITRVYLG